MFVLRKANLLENALQRLFVAGRLFRTSWTLLGRSPRMGVFNETKLCRANGKCTLICKLDSDVSRQRCFVRVETSGCSPHRVPTAQIVLIWPVLCVTTTFHAHRVAAHGRRNALQCQFTT